jgi:hypothetical protein
MNQMKRLILKVGGLSKNGSQHSTNRELGQIFSWYILSSGHFNGNIHGQVYRLFLTHGKGEYSKTNQSLNKDWMEYDMIFV